jgi:hypothetical protein
LELPQEQSTDPSEIFIIMTGNEEPTKDPLGNFPCLSTELPTPVSAASRLAEHCREKDGSLLSIVLLQFILLFADSTRT